MYFRTTFVFVLLIVLNSACESAEDQIRRKTEAAQKTSSSGASAPDGMAVFRKNCVVCHGSNGKLGLNGAKDLSQSTLTAAERTAIVTNGKNLMTPFGKILTAEEIDAVVLYSLTFSEKSTPQ
ncbi:MAG: cytochrome c [Saprospiraceae bacterium]|nr:cytochrome c [Saprospiraceae bacterium]